YDRPCCSLASRCVLTTSTGSRRTSNSMSLEKYMTRSMAGTASVKDWHSILPATSKQRTGSTRHNQQDTTTLRNMCIISYGKPESAKCNRKQLGINCSNLPQN